MAAEIYFVIPGNPAALTGGYLYDKNLIAALRLRMKVQLLIWPGDYPCLTEADRLYAASSLQAVPEGSLTIIDGLAFGALPALMTSHATRLRLIALVHHPLGYETGLPPALRQDLIAAERQALGVARHIITTSRRTAQTLQDDFGVPQARLTVARPGSTAPTAPAPRRQDGIMQLLAVGAVIPRKGYDILAAALAALRDLPWQCSIIGALDRDPRAAAALRAQLTATGLATRIRLLGEVADVRPFYAAADFFVLASHYEGFGMAYAEAVQNGLPVVGTTGGAIQEAVPAGAGLLIPPGDVAAFTAALRALLTDAELRQRMSAVARRAAASQPGWEATARIVAEALHNLSERPRISK